MSTVDKYQARPETEIVADEQAPSITITREFDAPPERLFRAWTDPELVARWMGPRDVALTMDRWDCRTGGSYRYTAAAGDGGLTAFFGSFHEIREPSRLVQTFTWEGAPDGVSLETMTFEELPDGRTRSVAFSMMDSFESRDAMLSSGMDVGVREGYEQLDELLASQA